MFTAGTEKDGSITIGIPRLGREKKEDVVNKKSRAIARLFFIYE